MRKSINIQVANPSGNVTIFVMDKFNRNQYVTVANQLLAMKDLKGEQVSFILDEEKMEMCGLEFCGNATRAFALIKAKNEQIKGDSTVNVDVSGCDEKLKVTLNTDTDYVKLALKPPLSIYDISFNNLGIPNCARAVDLDGILHIVFKDLRASDENFKAIKDYVLSQRDIPALGVMFFNAESGTLTPVVYVKDVDTTYFEGSCGSGTVATADILALEKGEDGVFTFSIPQPAGTINSTVVVKNNSVVENYIEGYVELSPVQSVEIDI